MKRLVKLKIDVTEIDKSRLFKGSKGTYLDAAVFLDDLDDQYGNNGMITQEVSKEERDQGVRGAILGNAKIVWSEGSPSQNSSSSQQGETPATVEDSDIPF